MIAAGRTCNAIFGHGLSGAFTSHRYFFGFRMRSMRSAASLVIGPCVHRNRTRANAARGSRHAPRQKRVNLDGFISEQLTLFPAQ
jgi:hypothetical protein